jgi:hypothetical protein
VGLIYLDIIVKGIIYCLRKFYQILAERGDDLKRMRELLNPHPLPASGRRNQNSKKQKEGGCR